MNSTGNSIEVILTGTGTSHGIPVVGCHCPVCRSINPRNKRLRTGVVIKTPLGNIQIDTSPDLRQQHLANQIEMIHAVLYTHGHADHIYGLDDLRIFCHQLDHALPLYAETAVSQRLIEAFPYAFVEPSTHAIGGGVPQLQINQITTVPFEVLGILVKPIRLLHGQLPILGYRIGNFAFCTDVSQIPMQSYCDLEDLDILVIDALRYRPHATHFSIEQAIGEVEKIKPKQAYLTHLCHDLDHEILSQQLPTNIKPAYDGLKISIGQP
jgi:phosphoribosyl 1,2-cyclic phosphate phosphodiesterase